MQDDASGRATFDLAIASLRAGSRALVAAGPGSLVGELQASGGEWTRLDFTKSGMMARRRTVQALEALIRSEQRRCRPRLRVRSRPRRRSPPPSAPRRSWSPRIRLAAGGGMDAQRSADARVIASSHSPHYAADLIARAASHAAGKDRRHSADGRHRLVRSRLRLRRARCGGARELARAARKRRSCCCPAGSSNRRGTSR